MAPYTATNDTESVLTSAITLDYQEARTVHHSNVWLDNDASAKNYYQAPKLVSAHSTLVS